MSNDLPNHMIRRSEAVAFLSTSPVMALRLRTATPHPPSGGLPADRKQFYANCAWPQPLATSLLLSLGRFRFRRFLRSRDYLTRAFGPMQHPCCGVDRLSPTNECVRVNVDVGRRRNLPNFCARDEMTAPALSLDVPMEASGKFESRNAKSFSPVVCAVRSVPPASGGVAETRWRPVEGIEDGAVGDAAGLMIVVRGKDVKRQTARVAVPIAGDGPCPTLEPIKNRIRAFPVAEPREERLMKAEVL